MKLINKMNNNNNNIKLFNEFKASDFKTPAGEWHIKKWNLDDIEYIDLNDKTVKIQEDVNYQFLGVTFRVKYIPNVGNYFALISYPHPITGDIPDSVVYAENLEEMKSNIRFNIKKYKEEYNLM